MNESETVYEVEPGPQYCPASDGKRMHDYRQTDEMDGTREPVRHVWVCECCGHKVWWY